MTTKDTNNNKKKISAFSTTLITAALIIIIAANAVVWKSRLDKGSEIISLTEEIARISREIKTATSSSENLEAKLTKAQASLSEAKADIPGQFNRNDIIDYIINLSRECKVEVLPISSQGWVTEKSSQAYVILKLNITATGSFTQINTFIDKLQHSQYDTLRTPGISVTRKSTDEIKDVFSGDTTDVITEIGISVYALPDKAEDQ